ncbi:hypothetical protein Tco_1119946 [Tanacetum coccineum]
MSVRPKDVERFSSVVEGRVLSKTGTAQMQSPEVDSATQLDDSDVCLVAYALLMWSSGLCPSDTVLWLVPFSCSYGISWWNSILVRESCDSQFIQRPFLSHMKVPPNVCVGFIKIRTRGAKVELASISLTWRIEAVTYSEGCITFVSVLSVECYCCEKGGST